MKKYEVMICNDSGGIVLVKLLEAENVNNAIQQILDNVELLDGDTIQVKLNEV